MPYSQKTELPQGVQNSLPKHAQEIYKEAYNSAWDQHDDKVKHEREEVSHRIAWAAVKKKYERSNGKWHKKDSG